MTDHLYHVLFIDDDDDFLKSMHMLASNILRQDNNDIDLEHHFVNDPNEGLAFVQTLTDQHEKIALIISDQQMPVLSGIEFIERANKIVPNASKILLTGYASLESAKYAINQKILDHYVSKPIEDYDNFGALLTNAIKTFHYREEKEIGEQEIKRYVKELELTNDKIREMHFAAEKIAYLAQGFKKLDLDDVLDLIVTQIPKLFRAECSSLFLMDDDGKSLQMVRSNYLRESFTIPVDSDHSRPMMAALKQNKTIIIPEIQNAPYEFLNKECLGKSCIIIPFIVGFDAGSKDEEESAVRVKGALNMGNIGDMWSEELVHYSATLIQNILGINILKARLYQRTQQLAILDSLTGLYNKHIFLELLKKECSYSERNGKSLFLAFSDIDDFKTINDTYGHQIGDQVLSQIGRSYKTVARSSDLTARFGGDEFVWLIKDADAEDAIVLFERFITMVSSSKFPKLIHPHISTGLARYAPKCQDSPEKLIARADEALYRAKSNGKKTLEVDIHDREL